MASVSSWVLRGVIRENSASAGDGTAAVQGDDFQAKSASDPYKACARSY